MNDSAILLKIKDQDEVGLSLLIDKYGRYVSAIVSNLSKGAMALEDVEETSADVFISIWNNAHTLRKDSSLKPYIAQIARNKTIDQLRKKEHPAVQFDDDILILSKDGIPDELAVRREQEEIINRAVKNLGEPEREIFIRFYYFGEQVKHIANRLSLNPATVKTKLHRSRKQLKSIFEERGYRYEG